MTRFVNYQIHAVDQMPLVRIVCAPEEIQTGDYRHCEFRKVFLQSRGDDLMVVQKPRATNRSD